MRLVRSWKLFAMPLLAVLAVVGCQKEASNDALVQEGSPFVGATINPATPVLEPSAETVQYCQEWSAPVPLKIQVSNASTSGSNNTTGGNGGGSNGGNGGGSGNSANTSSDPTYTQVGTISVNNDAEHLYIKYELDEGYYFNNTKTYVGPSESVPQNGGVIWQQGEFNVQYEYEGAEPTRTVTLKVPLSELSFDEGTDCPEQLFIISSVHITGEQAWTSVTTPENHHPNKWASGFTYCVLRCDTWCAMSQGYWFASGKHDWCLDSDDDGEEADVVFGSLIVQQSEGVALWAQTGTPTVAQKAFFQAAALQLSMHCTNDGDEIPESIRTEYQTLYDFLATLSTAADLANDVPADKKAAIEAATGAIGDWISENHCDE